MGVIQSKENLKKDIVLVSELGQDYRRQTEGGDFTTHNNIDFVNYEFCYLELWNYTNSNNLSCSLTIANVSCSQ